MALDLKDLLSIVSEEDGNHLKSLVERNPKLSERIEGGERLLHAWADQGQDLAALLGNSAEPPKRQPAIQSSAPEQTQERAQDLQTATLDLAKFNEKFMPEVTKAIESYAGRIKPELQKEIEWRSLSKMDELMSLKLRHQKDFNEEIGLKDIVGHAEKNPGRFQTATDAYEDMVRERRNEALINKRAEEKYQEKLREVQNTVGFPGTTPTQTDSSPLFDYFNKGAENTTKDLAVRALEEFQKGKLTPVN